MPCWNSKRAEEMGLVKERGRGRGRGERKKNGLFFLPFPSPFSFFRSFALAAIQGLLFLLSPIFLCHTWIKDSALTQPGNPLVPKPDTRKMNEFWKETIFFLIFCSCFLLFVLIFVRKGYIVFSISLYITQPEIRKWPDIKFFAHAQYLLR